MADMTTHLMLDDINVTIEARHIADKNVVAIAGYVNGRFANWPAIVAKWGNSGKHLVSIDVQANPGAGAQCLDVERGDAVPAQAGPWAKETRKAGMAAKDLRYFPKIYTSQSQLQAVVDSCTKAGLKRDEYMLWSAHYGAGAHICGPKTCGSPVQADATQYTDAYDGVSLDATLAFGYFFLGAPKPVVPPKPALVKVPNVVGKTHNDAAHILEADGFKVDAPSVPAGDSSEVIAQKPAAGAEVDKGATVTLDVKLFPPPPPGTPPVGPILVPPPLVPVPPVVPSPPVVPPVVDPVPVPTPDPAPVPVPVVDPVAHVVTAFVRTDYADASTVDVPAGAILFVPREFNNG